MLVVGRKAGEKIVLRHDDWPGDVEILVTSIDGLRGRKPEARLGIRAAQSITVIREELLDGEAWIKQAPSPAALRSQVKAVSERSSGKDS